MITSALESFRENLSEKTRNPYIGTLIIVWCIENWFLIYGIFTFDEGATQTSKIQFIQNYFIQNGFVGNFFKCAMISFFVLIGTYLAINLSRLIINFYENFITPQVYKLTNENSIVLKERYVSLEKENAILKHRAEQERDERLKLQAERDKYETRAFELFKQKEELEEIVAINTSPEIQAIQKGGNSPDLVPLNANDILEVERKILSHIGHVSVRDVINGINAGRQLDALSEGVVGLVKHGIIKHDRVGKSIDSAYYSYTPFGRTIIRSYVEKYM